MSEAWPAPLAARGAHVEDGVVRSFGDPAGELAAADGGSLLADLSHLALLGCAGADARAFLHSQLSCDVQALAADAATLGAYCSPQGRMLASFLLWPDEAGFVLALSRSLLAPIEKRLRMYVLRSKVVVAARADRVLLGTAGPAAGAAVSAILGGAPPAPQRVARGRGIDVVGLARDRFVLAVPRAETPAAWDALAATLRPAGTPCWEWLDLRSGVPLVTAATQDAFVPQMANLELVGGVSFQKGCYPGQEVVARTQYLGKSKRRLFLAHLDADAHPAPGDDLFSADLGDQASGTIVNAAAAPGGGFDVLAVVTATSVAGSTVHLRALDGPRLRFDRLPYPVP